MTQDAPSVRLLYFAWIRETIGRAEERVALPSHVDTIHALVSWLKERGPEYKTAFAQPDTVRAAIDRQHVKADTGISGAKEIAFFPPVTGG